ncbi:MAG: penicillin-binding protein 1C [Chitinophagales bacterium]|nr:penicillin-binding protein 1C [Chitinophagales bacterium]
MPPFRLPSMAFLASLVAACKARIGIWWAWVCRTYTAWAARSPRWAAAMQAISPYWANVVLWYGRGRNRYWIIVPLCGLLVFGILDLIFPFPVRIQYSQTISDRDGKLLHAFLTNDDKWRMKTELSEITPEFRRAILFKEDRWFYWHCGINPLAVGRALLNNALYRKRTSGASTITMQVARLLQPKQRSYANKLVEMWHAMQLEWHLSKDEILQLYLNLVPYGGNIEGIKSAAVLFLNKMPDHLSLAEITTLTVIPNRPNTLRLGTKNDAIRAARNEWLAHFEQARLFSQADIADALDEPLSATRRESPKLAPHFSQRMRRNYPQTANIRTDLSLDKQQQVTQLTANYIRRLYSQHIRNAAVLVINNRTQKVEAYIGSADFNNPEDGGQCDGVTALRSPGSTLKPFLTALSFDAGIAMPKLKITDVPINIVGYAPENYDNKFNGYLTIEESLRLSLNVPFVKLLYRYGVNNFRRKMADAQFSLFRDPKHKLGLSAILGGCGVTLEELTRLYSQFALIATAPHAADSESTSDDDDNDSDTTAIAKTLFSPQAAYIVTEILSQLSRPDLPKNIDNVKDLPRIAWKTGTSYGRRDAWSIGYNANYTVGVWVGNFSGEGVPELNGAQSATPLLFDIFNSIDTSPTPDWFAPPKEMEYRWVCAETGLPPEHYCTNQIMDAYLPAISLSTKCQHLREVAVNMSESFSYCTACMPTEGFKRKTYTAYPPELVAYYEREHTPYERIPPHNPQCSRLFDGAAPMIASPVHDLEYLIDRADKQQIMLQCNVSNDVETVYWYVNDTYIGEAQPNDRLFFDPQMGNNHVTCLDDKGRKSEAIIRVKFL